jgi:hypothetical protein
MAVNDNSADGRGRRSADDCSRVHVHPGAPTGNRAISELLEALADRRGGIGLFTYVPAARPQRPRWVRLDGRSAVGALDSPFVTTIW